MQVRLDVAEGVHAITHAYTNCYLISDDDGVTLVDACFPSTWRAVTRILQRIGRSWTDVKALLLTHGHFDHVGFARRLATDLSVPVWVHAADRQLAANPYRYRPERNRAVYALFHPRSLPILATMVAAGALTVRGVEADHLFADREELPVPGQPCVIHTPGHTEGQCAFLIPGRSVLLSGDALVTLDPYTGRTGPGLVAPAATANSAQALSSLDQLVDLDAEIVLTGHGEPWSQGAFKAVALARRRSARA
jgi:glyoxylase-like metal-dependent hydrolase (beta-lactamase superfamily II)